MELNEAREMSFRSLKPLLIVLVKRKHCGAMNKTINYLQPIKEKFTPLLLIENEGKGYQNLIDRFPLKLTGEATLVLWDVFGMPPLEHDITYSGFGNSEDEKVEKKLLIDEFKKSHYQYGASTRHGKW